MRAPSGFSQVQFPVRAFEHDFQRYNTSLDRLTGFYFKETENLG